MATIDQKERYRQRAALCYEIAATLSADTAASMRRLGDSYTGLAETSDKFDRVTVSRYEQHISR
jgi:hypothetical protein